MKLGKRSATEDSRDLKLTKYAVVLPKVPARFGHGSAFTNWGMLGNDNYGDCVWAGAAHETMLLTKLGAAPTARFTDKAVLGDYSAVTGFNPADPSTDQGTDVRDALKYRKATGVHDAGAFKHRIGAYVKLEHDWTLMLQAVYLFGVVGMGFQFPDTAMNQFNDGEPWDVRPDAQIEGGHYVPVVGSMSSSKRATCVTWGKRQEFTRAFFDAYTDELWTFISLELLDGSGHAPHGLDLTALKADLAAL